MKIAQYFEECGVDNIMIDLETLGKAERQNGLNTVKSSHCFEDVSNVKQILSKSKCLVRVNPVYEGSKAEIDEVVKRGADIIMLPMFKRKNEVETFIDLVGERAKKYLLLETPQALTRVNEILEVKGIDAVHIGLNDLSIGLGLDFLYETLIGGIVEYLAQKITAKKIKFGFGGISRIEKSKNILSEHYRLGSKMVILNRDFRDYKETYEEIIAACDLKMEIRKIDDYYRTLQSTSEEELLVNKEKLFREIKQQIKSL
ncbi:MAG: aldolase [Bacteroidales bacterium]|nr:aldolase [Bacteroidales bacterium]